MSAEELQSIKMLVYEYYRLWTDRYGHKKELPAAFYDMVDLVEHNYGVYFNTNTWQWEKLGQ